MLKRITAITLVLALACSLSGCIVIPLAISYDTAHDSSEFTAVALYRVDRDNYPYTALIEPAVATLKPEEFENFHADLTKLPFTDYIIIMLAAMDPSFSFGEYAIKIEYENGDYELISNAGYQEVHFANGEISTNHYSIDGTSWSTFLKDQFGIE